MVSLLSITQQSNIFIPFFCFGNFLNVCGLYSSLLQVSCGMVAGWLRVSRECLKWGPFENKKRDWQKGVSNGSKVIQTVKTALVRFSSKNHKNKALTIQYR
ncbi:hypothetical protein BC624_11325 [Flavobacterium granuli]|uniref:Uncharacterized protein n=1 Tax=Flavobacterium granuli TaxID=280093 RepID=A0A1M5QLH5_9FLAO|nr:hypothetical protein BC624_11325 [Flavobacterium granuli]SHH14985.1 hypothetical protein SAMN05443373_10850 [Flavobacterium granuli]